MPHIISGLRQKKRTWRQKWFYLPDNEREQLRQKYNYNRQSYFDDFQPDEECQDKIMELSMAAFTRLQAKMLQRAQFNHYERQGYLACSNLLSSMPSKSSLPDLVFIALDFEGTVSHKGVTEMGLARLDVRHLEQGIQGTNIATARRSRRDFLFQDYRRIDLAQLPTTIASSFTDKHIVLVGHNIQSELTIMEQLGVPIADFPNVLGIIDTFWLASADFGHVSTLESLMATLGISCEPNTFHCGGNDAHYTMQAFLALLLLREERAGGRPDHRVPQRLRELAWAKAPLKREIRRKMDEARDLSCDAENFGGFGNLFGHDAECPA